MCTKVVSSHESLMTFSSKESFFLFFFLFLQSSFAELRPLDFGIRTICQSNVLLSEVN